MSSLPLHSFPSEKSFRMSGKRKRKCLSVNDKQKILREVDEGTLTKTEIARKYGIPKNSLSTIIKARQKIADIGGVTASRKYFRDVKFPEMEKGLLAWLQQISSENIPINGSLIKEQANLIASNLDLNGFKASDGWLQKFKMRHCPGFRKDTSTTNEWKEEGNLKSLISEYSPEDVFNVDERGLFFKVLPDKTLVLKDTYNFRKKVKQRITVLFGANMVGSEKLPLLFVGKPRCFKNVIKLPSTYYANEKAVMTSEIYEKWLRELDQYFSEQNRKILLIVDNCHIEVSGLQAIRVEFLSPNATSVLQPVDQGIIHCFKRKYRRMLLKRVILNLELKRRYEIDVLGAMHLSVIAWNDVSQATIVNSFRRAGFVEGKAAEVEEFSESNLDLSTDEALMQELRRRDSEVPEDLTFQDFLNVEEIVEPCAEELSDEEISNESLNEKADEQSNDAEECTEAIPRPTIEEATEWLSGLRRFFETDNNSEMLANIDAMESYVYERVVVKQTEISDFFGIFNK